MGVKFQPGCFGSPPCNRVSLFLFTLPAILQTFFRKCPLRISLKGSLLPLPGWLPRTSCYNLPHGLKANFLLPISITRTDMSGQLLFPGIWNVIQNYLSDTTFLTSATFSIFSVLYFMPLITNSIFFLAFPVIFIDNQHFFGCNQRYTQRDCEKCYGCIPVQ